MSNQRTAKAQSKQGSPFGPAFLSMWTLAEEIYVNGVLTFVAMV